MSNTNLTPEEVEAAYAANRAAAAKYPALTHDAIVQANGKEWRVQGAPYVATGGSIKVVVKQQRNGKDYGPFRYMLVTSFAT